MPPSRACRQCRSAKAKCDLAAPVCGRCTARSLTCSGAAQGNLLFLNENAVAQRNSWLARRPRSGSAQHPPTSGSQSPQKAIELTDGDLQKLYYWLSDASLPEVPQPLRRDIDTRAVERFFLDWTLNPSNDGLSPGYLHDLPALFAAAQPGSILWNAVRAVAFADLKGYNGGSFAVKARESYGAALTRMRVIADDNRKLTQDRILAALLLVDVFELIYLSRREPLGPHKSAMKHILHLRGEEQLLDRAQFELWRTAQQRLQAQRITEMDGPDDEQLGWIAKLNTSLPDLHVCVDVERVVVLCSASRKLLKEDGGTRSRATTAITQQAEELLRTIRETIASMESWEKQVAAGWWPQRVETPFAADDQPQQVVITSLSESRVLQYSDPWLAYKFNFHAASQIVLRQSIIQVTEYVASLQSSGCEGDGQHQRRYAEEIVAAKQATSRLASTIIASCIPLLGFSKDAGMYPRGKMARRFFAICAMWVVQQARYASEEQRRTATEVLEWIDRAHRLG